MSDTFDLLLTGGTVLNPASGVSQELELGITDGRIAAIQPKLPQQNAKKILDVRGCYVTPGLIDFHVHSYWGVNPYGCELDCALHEHRRDDGDRCRLVGTDQFSRL